MEHPMVQSSFHSCGLVIQTTCISVCPVVVYSKAWIEAHRGDRLTRDASRISCRIQTRSTVTIPIVFVCIPCCRIDFISKIIVEIYRLDRANGNWIRIGNAMPKKVGDIGFPLVLHPHNPETLWVFPMDGTTVWPRTSPEGKPAVFRSTGMQGRVGPGKIKDCRKEMHGGRSSVGNDRGRTEKCWCLFWNNKWRDLGKQR